MQYSARTVRGNWRRKDCIDNLIIAIPIPIRVARLSVGTVRTCTRTYRGLDRKPNLTS